MPSFIGLVVTTLLFHTYIFSCAQPLTGKEVRLQIVHTDDFEVSGDGQSPAWQSTEWISLFRIKGSSPYETKVKILYSEKGIYALYHCEDRKINATMTEDFANLWHEDVIEIFLWPDEAYPVYFEYELSPLNCELPILVPNFNGEASGWRPWNYRKEKKTRKATKVHVDAQGDTTSWTGEFFIPYALMKPLQNIPPKKGTEWRANIYRIDYDETKPSYWSWQPIDKNFHEFRKYGTFVFD